ncbi:MAG: phosphopantetheine-binding protein [Patescibacteria group bacterium]|nr:phosphopantetheine-binding protein [Patescibacteria group bacterium]
MCIRKKVVGIILRTFPDKINNEKQIEDKANLLKDFGLDSLDIVELSVALEKKFNIEIPEEKLTTVGSVIEYFQNQNKKGGG